MPALVPELAADAAAERPPVVGVLLAVVGELVDSHGQPRDCGRRFDARRSAGSRRDSRCAWGWCPTPRTPVSLASIMIVMMTFKVFRRLQLTKSLFSNRDLVLCRLQRVAVFLLLRLS